MSEIDYGGFINWRELAFEALGYMYSIYGEKWVAQWLWDNEWSIGAINYLLGAHYTKENLDKGE